jgi:hypothetical protein
MAKPPFIVIPHEPVSVTGANAAPGRPASHLFEFLFPGMLWRMQTAATSATIQADFGSARPIDFAALLNVDRGGLSISAGVNLGATAGASGVYAGPAVPVPEVAQVPPPDEGQFHWFHNIAGGLSARHAEWRLQDGSAFTGGAAFAIAGQKITFARYAEHDWEVGVDDSSTVAFTRSGVPDVAEGSIQRTLSFTLKWVSEAEYFDKIVPLDRVVGRRKPVLICFDEDAGARRQALTYFGLLTDNGRSRRINARAFERRFEIRSFI